MYTVLVTTAGELNLPPLYLLMLPLAAMSRKVCNKLINPERLPSACPLPAVYVLLPFLAHPGQG